MAAARRQPREWIVMRYSDGWIVEAYVNGEPARPDDAYRGKPRAFPSQRAAVDNAMTQLGPFDSLRVEPMRTP